jgi:uncharacterized protein (DUF4415 family)
MLIEKNSPGKRSSSRRAAPNHGWWTSMKRTEKGSDVKTSTRAQRAGLRRIPRRHLTEPDETKLSDCKVRVTMYLDADVLEYFKGRAGLPNAAPYQTQINSELRAVMGRGGEGAPYSSLVDDDRPRAAILDEI